MQLEVLHQLIVEDDELWIMANATKIPAFVCADHIGSIVVTQDQLVQIIGMLQTFQSNLDVTDTVDSVAIERVLDQLKEVRDAYVHLQRRSQTV